jgi:hypothetical protein
MNQLSIIGLSLNTIGSVLLAFSLGRIINMINTSLTTLEVYKDSISSSGDILSFTGMDIHRSKALKKSKNITIIGLILLISGFLLQLLSLIKGAN